jgi:molybdopterin/thiamine biosynthesis adenylyltransferase
MSNIYDRQKTLNIDRNMSISVVGTGGVGYHVAKLAAMSGIETIHLFDPDTFDETNLNRVDLPMSSIGKNKAMVTKGVINFLRPETTVVAYPFKFQEATFGGTDWIIDCTDNANIQALHQEIARKKGAKYMKVGYDGEHITLANNVGEWGEAPGGYTITPSWVVPAIVISALAVGKLMKYSNLEISANLQDLYRG